MLSGCPDCGGNTFQFRPDSKSSESIEPSSGTPSTPKSGESRVTETVSKATRTVREWVTDSEGDIGGRGEETDRSPVSSETGPQTNPKGGSGGSSEAAIENDDEAPDLEPSGTGDYPEWPNPDGADTSGVGKGPSARRERQAAAKRDSNADESSRDSTEESSAVEPSQSETGDADAFEWTKDPASSSSDTHSSVGPEEEPDFDTDNIQGRTEGHEDNAQSSARSDMVSPDELPGPTAAGGAGPEPTDDSEGADGVPGSGGNRRADRLSGSTQSDSEHSDDRLGPDPAPEKTGPNDGRVVETPSNDGRPDLDELREELNEQFESIKIVERGQYELNLMELYDREEYIISLREDGRYVIEVADSWRGDG
jgi:predicted  nucleic acid-binding Zn-ribbon protein